MAGQHGLVEDEKGNKHPVCYEFDTPGRQRRAQADDLAGYLQAQEHVLRDLAMSQLKQLILHLADRSQLPIVLLNTHGRFRAARITGSPESVRRKNWDSRETFSVEID